MEECVLALSKVIFQSEIREASARSSQERLAVVKGFSRSENENEQMFVADTQKTARRERGGGGRGGETARSFEMSQIHPDQAGVKASGDIMANNALGSLTPFLFFSSVKENEIFSPHCSCLTHKTHRTDGRTAKV